MIEVYQVLEDLERRLSNLLRVGFIQNKGDEPSDRVRVKIGELHSAPLAWLTQRAGNDRTWWNRKTGNRCWCFLLPVTWLREWYCQRYIGTIITPVSDPDKRVSVFADGAWFEYDRKAKHLKGVLPDGATTELVSSGGIELTGDLLVKGNITSTQDITEKIRSMAVDRGIYNGHSHPGVLAGPDRTPVGSRSRLNGLPFSFLEKICTMRRV